MPVEGREKRAAKAASISDTGAPVKTSNGTSMKPSDTAVTCTAPILREATEGRTALCPAASATIGGDAAARAAEAPSPRVRERRVMLVI
jgi:hypothetical protein